MISALKEIEFHDLPVGFLNLDFINDKIQITVKDYDNVKKDYFEIKLIFSGIGDFYFEKTKNIRLDEIYDCLLEERENGYYIEFTMLYNRPSISCILSFLFKEVIVEIGDTPNW